MIKKLISSGYCGLITLLTKKMNYVEVKSRKDKAQNINI